MGPTVRSLRELWNGGVATSIATMCGNEIGYHPSTHEGAEFNSESSS